MIMIFLVALQEGERGGVALLRALLQANRTETLRKINFRSFISRLQTVRSLRNGNWKWVVDFYRSTKKKKRAKLERQVMSEMPLHRISADANDFIKILPFSCRFHEKSHRQAQIGL